MDFKFTPFANDDQVLNLGPDGGITVENGTESLAIYGDITIENTPQMHERVDELIELLTRIKKALPPAGGANDEA